MTDIKPCNVRNDKELHDLLIGLVDGEESVVAKILDGTHYVLAAEAIERIHRLDVNDPSTVDAASSEIRVFPDDLQVCEASLAKINDVSSCLGLGEDSLSRRLIEANSANLTKSCFNKYAESSPIVAKNAAFLLTWLIKSSETLLNEIRMDSSFARTIVAAWKKYEECDFVLSSDSEVSARSILSLISTIVSSPEDGSPVSPFQDALFSGSCGVLDLVVSMLRKYSIETDTVKTLVVLDAQYVFRILLDGVMATEQPQGTASTTMLRQYMEEKVVDLILVAAYARHEVRRQLVDDRGFSDLDGGLEDLVNTLTVIARYVVWGEDVSNGDDDDDDNDDDDDEGDAGEEEGGDDAGQPEEEKVEDEEEQEECNDDVSKGTIDSEENVSSK